MNIVKRICLLSWLGLSLAVGLTACGDGKDDDSNTPGSGGGNIVADCQAGCNAGKSLMCEPDMTELCMQLCSLYDQATAACKEAAGPYFACAKDAEYECGLLGAAIVEQECQPEREAFDAACNES